MRLASALTCLVLALGAPVAAQPSERVVVVSPASDLLDRVRGQTADLPYTLVEREHALDDRFEDALGLGERERAPIVLAFDVTDAHVDVHVVEVVARRLFVRRVPIERDGRSAALEAAALVARSALSALADGGHVGVVVPPSEEPPSTPAIAPRVDPPRDPAALRVRLELGWMAALDGQAPFGLHAPELRGGLELGALLLLASFAVGLPVVLEDPQARLDVTRLRAALGAFAAIDVTPLRVVLGVELGAALWHRATVTFTDALVATPPAWSASPLVSARARLELALEPGIALGLGVGLDILPLAPTFTIGPEPRYALFNAQPFAELGLAVRAP